MSLREDPRFKSVADAIGVLADDLGVPAFPILDELSHVFQERLLTDEERAQLYDGPQGAA